MIVRVEVDGDKVKIPASGSCQCGNVNYEVIEEPLITVACHCQDCQKLSTSAFSVSMILKRTGFKIVSGELKSWERPTAASGVAVCCFALTVAIGYFTKTLKCRASFGLSPELWKIRVFSNLRHMFGPAANSHGWVVPQICKNSNNNLT